MKNPFYLAYGVFLIGFAAFASFNHWSLSNPNQPRTAPKTIRDNPGAFGAPYVGAPRYSGGK